MFPFQLEPADYTLVTFPAQTYLFHEGDQCQQVALVLAGSIRVSKIGANGREITLYRVVAGESCILMLASALSGRGYPATAYVEEEVRAMLIPVARFQQLLRKHEGVQQFVYGLLTERLVSVMTLLEEIVFRKLDERLLELLLERTQSRPVWEVTHDEIALELGTAREVVSRLLKEMEREGLLKLGRGRIEIADRGKLVAKLPGK